MTSYVVARIEDVRFGPDITAYLERIDETLAPFGGRFRIHGGPFERLEGDWQGDLVAVSFPDRSAALAWYHSSAYQEILPLRTRNARSDAILIDGVDDAHKATDILAALASPPP